MSDIDRVSVVFTRPAIRFCRGRPICAVPTTLPAAVFQGSREDAERFIKDMGWEDPVIGAFLSISEGE